MRSVLLWSLPLWPACSPTVDYALGLEKAKNAPGYETITISADITLQRNNYGDTISRCQMQFAFSPLYDEDTAPDPPATPAWVVAKPEAPGTCAFSVQPLPDEGGTPGEPQEDNWSISGSLVGPDEILLYSDAVDLRLGATSLDDERLRYELDPADCDDITFPVGELLTLDVPEGETVTTDSLPGFFIDDALAVGPDVYLTAPAVDPDVAGDRVLHPVGDDLDVRWDFSGAPPVIAGTPIPPEVRVKIYNQDREREFGNEWLVCWPDQDGQLTIPAEELALLTVNPSPDEDRWFAGLAVHTSTDSPAFEAPWGEPVQLRAHISEGGLLILHEP
jgi:hypothetical protein